MRSDTPRPIIFGEVLFDCFEDGSRVLGGAPFNVAWNLFQLGENPLFISRIGDDDLGHEIITVLQRSGFDTTGIQVDKQRPTGRVEVSVVNGEASYTIVPEQAYDFIEEQPLPALANGGILYHGTLGIRHPAALAALTALKANADVPVLLDVNLRKPWDAHIDLNSLLQNAHWCKLNGDEFTQLLNNTFSVEPSSLGAPEKQLAEMVLDSAHLEGLLITQGEKGACAYQRGQCPTHISPQSDTTVVDTVGAGDAFCSVFLLGLLRGWPMPETLQRAQTFASSVVGLKGATSMDTAFYNQFKQQWLNNN